MVSRARWRLGSSTAGLQNARNSRQEASRRKMQASAMSRGKGPAPLAGLPAAVGPEKRSRGLRVSVLMVPAVERDRNSDTERLDQGWKERQGWSARLSAGSRRLPLPHCLPQSEVTEWTETGLALSVAALSPTWRGQPVAMDFGISPVTYS